METSTTTEQLIDRQFAAGFGFHITMGDDMDEMLEDELNELFFNPLDDEEALQWFRHRKGVA